MVYLVLLAIGAPIGYGLYVYNRLALMRQAAERARANLDFLVKQRDAELARNTPETSQDRVSALELAIADRREFYNDEVNRYNALIGRLPGVLLARLFALAPRQPLALPGKTTGTAGQA